MPSPTKMIVDRQTAEVMLGAIRASRVLATEWPQLFAHDDAARLLAAEHLLLLAIARVRVAETRQAERKMTFRERLAAHIAFPTGPKGW